MGWLWVKNGLTCVEYATSKSEPVEQKCLCAFFPMGMLRGKPVVVNT